MYRRSKDGEKRVKITVQIPRDFEDIDLEFQRLVYAAGTDQSREIRRAIEMFIVPDLRRRVEIAEAIKPRFATTKEVRQAIK